MRLLSRTIAPIPQQPAVATGHVDPEDPGAGRAPVLGTIRLGLRRRRHSLEASAKITDVDVFYGTVTGTCLRLATTLADGITPRGVRVCVHDLEDFDELLLTSPERRTPTRVAVFLLSTHFAGSPPPSVERFYQWLRGSTAGIRQNETTKLDATREATEPTGRSNVHVLIHWLSRRHSGPYTHPRGPLHGLQYAVFGAGNSSYVTYNAVGKFADAKLAELGATRFQPLGLGDASRDTSGDFDKWAAAFLQRLPFLPPAPKSPLPSPSGLTSALSSPLRKRRSVDSALAMKPATSPRGEPMPPPVTARLEFLDNFNRPVVLRLSCKILANDPFRGGRGRRASHPAKAPAAPGLRKPLTDGRLSLRNVHQDAPQRSGPPLHHRFPFVDILALRPVPDDAPSHPHRQATVLTPRLRLIDPRAAFAPGDTLGLFPHNLPEQVALVAERFGYDLDAWIDLAFDPGYARVGHERLPFPTPCSIRTALTEYLELRSLTRDFVRVAAGFVTDTAEREALEALASAEQAGAFHEHIRGGFKGLPALLAMAPSLRLPIEVFVNIAQPLRPRFFTIASSPRVHPEQLDLAITLGRLEEPCGLAVDFFRRLLRENGGGCGSQSNGNCGRSNSSSNNNARGEGPIVSLRGFLSPSHFVLPRDPSAPMIMIAQGVGVGPMRALLQEREYELALLGASALGRGRGRPVSTNVLLVGSPDAASLVYGADFRQWHAQGLLRLHAAHSRGPATMARHVQELVVAHLEFIVELLEAHPSGRLYVSGRAAMAASVRELFVEDQRRRGVDWFDQLRHRGGYTEAGHG